MALQHRSIERHLEGVSRWAEVIASGGGGGRIAAGRRYAELVEIMLEHAQMEERFLFPLLERAAEDRGTSPPHQSLDPKHVHLGGFGC